MSTSTSPSKSKNRRMSTCPPNAGPTTKAVYEAENLILQACILLDNSFTIASSPQDLNETCLKLLQSSLEYLEVTKKGLNDLIGASYSNFGK